MARLAASLYCRGCCPPHRLYVPYTPTTSSTFARLSRLKASAATSSRIPSRGRFIERERRISHVLRLSPLYVLRARFPTRSAAGIVSLFESKPTNNVNGRGL